jgi:hypothetical protein
VATAFISHASEDREVAERICHFLEQRGIRCWMAPRDVRPGRRYGEEIVFAIEAADAVVLLLTENANASTFVEREIERAVSYGKPTLPVRVREVQPSRSLELFISNAHWIDAWKPPIEQYLDRLAESIRSLGPNNSASAGQALPAPPRTEEGVGSNRLWRRGIAIGAAIFLIAGSGALVAWWLGANKRSASSSTTQSTAPPAFEQTPKNPPAPPVTASSPVGAQPVTASDSLKSFLILIGNNTGPSRYKAIQENAQSLPNQLTTDDLLVIIKGTAYRTDAIKLLINRLPGQMPVNDALKILGTTTGSERFALIELVAPRLPAHISTKELSDLIVNSSYRNDAIKLLVGRLPNPLPVPEMATLLAATSRSERYALIEMLGPRLPPAISVDNLLEITNNTGYRNDAIKLLLSRLPSPITVEDLSHVLGSTSGTERYNLIEILGPRAPAGMSAEQIVNLARDSAYRDQAQKLLQR